MTKILHVYTDGSCVPNPGLGGWGAVLLYDKNQKAICGGAKRSTNNEMELTAILEALLAIKNRDHPMIIYTDSQYAINCLTVWGDSWEKSGWKKKGNEPIKNLDLIKRIRAMLTDSMTFQWVKGHAGDYYNELAHTMAEQGRTKKKPLTKPYK